jgi:hypothetical protein
MNDALQTWLETATRNLAPRAVTQISNEITAHLQSAAAQHRLEGMGEDAALELAVRELGSAKAAARGYRRAHLTIGEFKALNRHDLPIASWMSVLIPTGATGIWLNLTSRTPQLELVFFYLGLMLYSLLFLVSSLCKQFERKALYQLFAVVAIWVTSVVGSVYSVSFQQQTLMSTMILIASVTACYTAIRQWMTWQKLRLTPN